MRIGEILALNINDIDFDKKIISVSKTLTRNINGELIVGTSTKTETGIRTIPILLPLQPILEKYLTYKGYLFLENDKFIFPSVINAHFKRICKNANIKVTTCKVRKSNNTYVNLKTSTVNTHMLRHTFATRCIEASMNPAVLQKILGHKDIQVTLNTYTSIFNKYKEKEIEKVEQYFSQLH